MIPKEIASGLKTAAAEELVRASLLEILSSTRLLSMATIRQEGPWINNALFSFDSTLDIFFLSPPTTTHSLAVLQDPRVAIAIVDSQQTGDLGKQGLQATGACRRADGEALTRGLRTYRERFPDVGTTLDSAEALEQSGMESRLWCIYLGEIKLFDEPRFGAETWIEVEVDRSATSTSRR
jgi:uncharacterized protein YhbP (UPF0306 family)